MNPSRVSDVLRRERERIRVDKVTVPLNVPDTFNADGKLIKKRQAVDMLQVTNVELDEVVLQCAIGDDEATEKMADFLSSKHYPGAAETVRRLVREARMRR